MSILSAVVVGLLIALVIIYLRHPIVTIDDSQTFIPSQTFRGKKTGFVFTTRDGVTGYYKDDKNA